LIRKIDANFVASIFAGSTWGYTNGYATYSQFSYVYDVAFGNRDDLYLVDTWNQRIRVVLTSGVVSTIAGNGANSFSDGQGTNAAFNGPQGIAVDKNENIYVADYWNSRIRRITPSGTVTTYAGTGSSGNNDGFYLFAEFSNPIRLTADININIYVSDFGNNRIRKINSLLYVSTLAGTTSGNVNGFGTFASFNAPKSLSYNQFGDIYIADTGNSLVRRLSSNGVVSTWVGSTAGNNNGLGTYSSFKWPSGLALGLTGIIYVSDSAYNQIRMISDVKNSPTGQPSSTPSSQPSCSPSVQPSNTPSAQPSLQPFSRPTRQPTRQPSSQPSM
jgi:hypothetical protein